MTLTDEFRGQTIRKSLSLEFIFSSNPGMDGLLMMACSLSLINQANVFVRFF